jgi:hypothetical protein
MPDSEDKGLVDDSITGIAAIHPATGSHQPPPLAGDPRRQAVPSIRGTVYQAWWSIDAWLRLTDDNTVIFLEGAEDFDVVRDTGNAVAAQIRNTSQPISLGTQKARQALEAFWKVTCNEPYRRVDLHYLTTSPAAVEMDADFGGIAGIEAWRIAQTDREMASRIASYLAEQLEASSVLRAFLRGSSPEVIQERLFQRFHWFMNQSDLDAVKRSVDDRIAALVVSQNRPISLVAPIRKALESRFWELIVRTNPIERCLTHGDLVRQVAESTHTYLPIPLDRLPALMSRVYPGFDLLDLLLQKVPTPPMPLLDRSALTNRLIKLIQQRKVVLITGTVYKGKSTLAQLGAASLCPDAWWVSLTERPIKDVDNLLLALGQRIDLGILPGLIIIDDIDITEKAYRAYHASLQLVLHRAYVAGCGVILTAQGGTQNSSIVRDFANLELLEVEAVADEELTALCLSHGCQPDLAQAWASLIFASTHGHPKLVQVRLGELAAQAWPAPNANDLLGASPGVLSTRHIARELLSQTVTPQVAELVYMIAQSSVPVHRSVAMHLAESVPNLLNGGDVVAGLAGRWLESVEDEGLRATALLQGTGTEIWTPAKLKAVHLRLYNALLSKSPLTPSEAAATLFHAYLAAEPRNISLAALRLQLLADPEAMRQVNRNLQWLTWLSLDPGQSLADSSHTGAILRSLQFRVAVTIDSNSLPRICERWAEEIERIDIEELKTVMRAMRWISLGITNKKIPLSARFQAIEGAETIPPDLRRNARLSADITGPLSKQATLVQAMFSCMIQSIRDYTSLQELVGWLDDSATDSIRTDFDLLLDWPLIQSMGAFVQSAWSSLHEQISDWTPWLKLFERIEQYALRRNSPRFGREASKARAIIFTEYLNRVPEALAVLDHATELFGSSPVLMEQRANVLFHVKDDLAVLELWQRLRADESSSATLDAFAYRRAAISAARLERWHDAEELFLAGASTASSLSTEPTRFGLMVDAAFVRGSAGDLAGAAQMLVNAIAILPNEAAEESNVRWEATLRVTSEVCRTVEARARGTSGKDERVVAGWASSPNLALTNPTPGQPARALLIRTEILRLAATICVDGPDSSAPLLSLLTSCYPVVRWLAAEARLALTYSLDAEPDFIGALLAFDRELINQVDIRKRHGNLLDRDEGPDALSNVHQPGISFPFVVAAMVCAGARLIDRLSDWEEASMRILGASAPLTLSIQSLLNGARQDSDVLERTVRNASNDVCTRVGAAARLLMDAPSVELTLQLQLFLTSAMASDSGISNQRIWNKHVAHRFGRTWRALADNPIQFIAPRISIPAILAAINELETGAGSLGKLISAVQTGVRSSVVSVVSKIY